jgi:hypothetical protein
MAEYTFAAGDEVKGNPGYVVAEGGAFEPFGFVLCRRKVDMNGPNCMFLAFIVAGVAGEAEGEPQP